MIRRLRIGTRLGSFLALIVLLGSTSANSVGATGGTPLPGATGALVGARSTMSAAWTDGACADASGVTVAVDFQQLGGGASLRCAPGPIADGFDALGRAGISFQTATRFPGFLCRIAGLPTSDPCITAAPATAYWSYWLASRGGPWCYSNLGAGNRRPQTGTVEGWSFSMTTDGATAPPPRVPVPDPIPGIAPASLGGADCDSTPPAALPVSPATATPPATAAPDPAAPPFGDAPAPAGVDDIPSDPLTPDAIVGSGAPTTGVPSTTEGDADTIRSTAPASGPAGTARTDDNGRELEEAVGVDLGDDGTTERTSPLGVVAAVVVIGSLGAGAHVVRRRAAHG